MFRALSILFAGLFLASTALAAGIEITPIHVNLTEKAPIATVRLLNNSTKPMSFQVFQKHWSQQKSKSELTSSENLVITPPIFTLKPGAQQLLRVGMVDIKPSKTEQSYRMIIQQLPGDGLQANDKRIQLQVLLAMSVPIFIKPITAANHQLDLTIVKRPDHTFMLSMKNTGNEHLQIYSLRLAQKNTPEFKQTDRARYILPNATQQLTLKKIPQQLYKAKQLNVIITSNWGTMKATITPNKPALINVS